MTSWFAHNAPFEDRKSAQSANGCAVFLFQFCSGARGTNRFRKLLGSTERLALLNNSLYFVFRGFLNSKRALS